MALSSQSGKLARSSAGAVRARAQAARFAPSASVIPAQRRGRRRALGVRDGRRRVVRRAWMATMRAPASAV
jgi:hypothetical protein